MPQSQVITRFSGTELEPAMLAEIAFASVVPVNIAPNSSIAAGTVLGQITNGATAVQVVSITGTPTGGTFTLNGFNPLTQAAFSVSVPYNATAANLDALLNGTYSAPGPLGWQNASTKNATVTGGALPGSAITVTLAGALVNLPWPQMTIGASALTGGSSPAASVSTTTVGNTAGTAKAYASGNSDGSQVAVAVLQHDVATDAFGYVYFTASGTPVSQWGQSRPDAPAYLLGVFRTADLIGCDATALSTLKARQAFGLTIIL